MGNGKKITLTPYREPQDFYAEADNIFLICKSAVYQVMENGAIVRITAKHGCIACCAGYGRIVSLSVGMELSIYSLGEKRMFARCLRAEEQIYNLQITSAAIYVYSSNRIICCNYRAHVLWEEYFPRPLMKFCAFSNGNIFALTATEICYISRIEKHIRKLEAPVHEFIPLPNAVILNVFPAKIQLYRNYRIRYAKKHCCMHYAARWKNITVWVARYYIYRCVIWKRRPRYRRLCARADIVSAHGGNLYIMRGGDLYAVPLDYPLAPHNWDYLFKFEKDIATATISALGAAGLPREISWYILGFLF